MNLTPVVEMDIDFVGSKFQSMNLDLVDKMNRGIDFVGSLVTVDYEDVCNESISSVGSDGVSSSDEESSGSDEESSVSDKESSSSDEESSSSEEESLDAYELKSVEPEVHFAVSGTEILPRIPLSSADTRNLGKAATKDRPCARTNARYSRSSHLRRKLALMGDLTTTNEQPLGLAEQGNSKLQLPSRWQSSDTMGSMGGVRWSSEGRANESWKACKDLMPRKIRRQGTGDRERIIKASLRGAEGRMPLRRPRRRKSGNQLFKQFTDDVHTMLAQDTQAGSKKTVVGSMAA